MNTPETLEQALAEGWTLRTCMEDDGIGYVAEVKPPRHIADNLHCVWAWESTADEAVAKLHRIFPEYRGVRSCP